MTWPNNQNNQFSMQGMGSSYLGNPQMMSPTSYTPQQVFYTPSFQQQQGLQINPNNLWNPMGANKNITGGLNPSSQPTGFDWKGNMGMFAQGAQALTGLGNLYLGFEALNQGKKQFDFSKNLANRNLQTQANLINEQLDRRARVTAGASGDAPQEQKDEYMDRMSSYRADNSKVG